MLLSSYLLKSKYAYICISIIYTLSYKEEKMYWYTHKQAIKEREYMKGKEKNKRKKKRNCFLFGLFSSAFFSVAFCNVYI
jgi:hypothetical protein